MFVYVWKHNQIPFYIGMSNKQHRTNPLNAGARGWLCKQTLAKIGPKNVVTELHITSTLEEAQALERSLIEKYGRIQLGTGTLTNLRKGGEGRTSLSIEEKTALSKRMKENNPMHTPEARKKARERMNDPDVKAKFIGENNPAKRPEVRAKLLAKWQDPEYKEKQHEARLGKLKHTKEEKEKRREALLNKEHPMTKMAFHKTLNTDPTIKAKRVAALQTLEVKAKMSEKAKASWAKRKAAMVTSKPEFHAHQ
jgi:hypothetical protein